jgi:hypothetical protein
MTRWTSNDSVVYHHLIEAVDESSLTDMPGPPAQAVGTGTVELADVVANTLVETADIHVVVLVGWS